MLINSASGRSLFDRIGKRSASPTFGQDSRSPPRHNNRSRGESPPRRGNTSYRHRSPLRGERRRTPSPYRHASPPSFYHPQRQSPRRSRRLSPPSFYHPRRAPSNDDDVVFVSQRPVSNQERARREADNRQRAGAYRMDYTLDVPDVPQQREGLREISANVPRGPALSNIKLVRLYQMLL